MHTYTPHTRALPEQKDNRYNNNSTYEFEYKPITYTNINEDAYEEVKQQEADDEYQRHTDIKLFFILQKVCMADVSVRPKVGRAYDDPGPWARCVGPYTQRRIRSNQRQ